MTSDVADTAVDGIVGSEDCLYLNIFAPQAVATGEPLPVMVWIHGGSNTFGHGGNYDASTLAQKQNVIVVTINYRLGPLGWFLHPAIIDDNASAEERSGNWGTLDMIRSLQWVQENIESFGGNRNKVLIFGESAGGYDVISLMLSPRAKGLFHSAVSQSGGLLMSSITEASNYMDDEQPGYPSSSSRELINKILIRDGQVADRGAAKKRQEPMSQQDVKTLLYEQTGADILAAALIKNDDKTSWNTRLIADGYVLPDKPVYEVLAAGNYNQVPIILGTNRDEYRYGFYADEEILKWFDTTPDDYLRVTKYPADAWKVRGVDAIADIISKVQGDRVFAYRFDWDEEGAKDGRDYGLLAGAYHTLELAFLFGDWTVGGFIKGENKNTILPPQRQTSINALSDSMMSYWAEMADNGKPGAGRNGKEVGWTAWRSGDNRSKTMILDSSNDGGIRMTDLRLTQIEIRQSLLADDNFESQMAHCWAYAKTFPKYTLQPDFEFNSAEYETLGKEGCVAYPPEDF